MAQRAHGWRAGAAVLAAAGLLVLGLEAPGASAAGEPRIDLKVLVVDNGDSPVEAVAAQLRSEGIPYTTVNLNDSGRPTIDPAFLSDTVDGTPRQLGGAAQRCVPAVMSRCSPKAPIRTSTAGSAPGATSSSRACRRSTSTSCRSPAAVANP